MRQRVPGQLHALALVVLKRRHAQVRAKHPPELVHAQAAPRRQLRLGELFPHVVILDQRQRPGHARVAPPEGRRLLARRLHRLHVGREPAHERRLDPVVVHQTQPRARDEQGARRAQALELPHQRTRRFFQPPGGLADDHAVALAREKRLAAAQPQKETQRDQARVCRETLMPLRRAQEQPLPRLRAHPLAAPVGHRHLALLDEPRHRLHHAVRRLHLHVARLHAALVRPHQARLQTIEIERGRGALGFGHGGISYLFGHSLQAPCLPRRGVAWQGRSLAP